MSYSVLFCKRLPSFARLLLLLQQRLDPLPEKLNQWPVQTGIHDRAQPYNLPDTVMGHHTEADPDHDHHHIRHDSGKPEGNLPVGIFCDDKRYTVVG